MPALPDAPNVLRVGFDYILGADSAAFNRIFLAYAGTAPTNANAATIASDIYTQAVTDLIPLIYTGVDLTGVTVADLTTPAGGAGAHIATTPGTRTGGVLPANAALLQNGHIQRRYRGGKPRTYWPFGVDGDLASPQVWSSASLTNFLSNLQAFYTGLAAISVGGCNVGGQVNISYYESFMSSQNPVTLRWRTINKLRTVAIIDPIMTITLNSHVSSQRRRTLIRA